MKENVKICIYHKKVKNICKINLLYFLNIYNDNLSFKINLRGKSKLHQNIIKYLPDIHLKL